MMRNEEELLKNAFDCDLCMDDGEFSSRMSEIDAQLLSYSSSGNGLNSGSTKGRERLE